MQTEGEWKLIDCSNDVVFHIHEFVREKCINYVYGFASKASKLDFQGVDW